MPTLVLTRRYSPDSNALWRAALDAGWDIERLQGYDPPAGLAERAPVFYGETLWADALRHPLRLALLQPTPDWLPRLPLLYRYRHIALTTLGVVRTELARAPAFVKAPDEKWFPARVYQPGEDPAPDLAADLPVLISEPVCFAVEFRLFVLERTVVARSPYIRAGGIAQDSDGRWPATSDELAGAEAFAVRLLTDQAIALPAAVVIDVGRLSDGRWAVVEANAAWAAGLCGCDPAQVLRVLQRASVRADQISTADRPWLRPAADEET